MKSIIRDVLYSRINPKMNYSSNKGMEGSIWDGL